MKEKTLFFDLDDTLIKCSGYYDELEDRLVTELCKYTEDYDYNRLRKAFNIKQVENIIEYGYGPKNYIISLKQITKEAAKENYEKYNLSEYIEKECAILYDLPMELLDGVEETVKYLYDKGYNMNIITKGMQDVQEKRVSKLTIKKYFKKYEIVNHKEKNDYLKITEKYGLDPKSCYMIGNSPKGDINEAKLAGFNTIYIPNKFTWGYEDEEILDVEPETKVLSSITQMMEIL